MLACARLRDETGLPELPREQSLAEHIVDFVTARVVKILSFEEDSRSTAIFSEAVSLRDDGGATGVRAMQLSELMEEAGVAPGFAIGILELIKSMNQRLGNKTPAKLAVVGA
jgi:hypothetical protein